MNARFKTAALSLAAIATLGLSACGSGGGADGEPGGSSSSGSGESPAAEAPANTPEKCSKDIEPINVTPGHASATRNLVDEEREILGNKKLEKSDLADATFSDTDFLVGWQGHGEPDPAASLEGLELYLEMKSGECKIVDASSTLNAKDRKGYTIYDVELAEVAPDAEDVQYATFYFDHPTEPGANARTESNSFAYEEGELTNSGFALLTGSADEYYNPNLPAEEG